MVLTISRRVRRRGAGHAGPSGNFARSAARASAARSAKTALRGRCEEVTEAWKTVSWNPQGTGMDERVQDMLQG